MSRWQEELEKVRAKHRGRLHAKHIVEAAKDKASALHPKFEWDNTKAGHKYRLIQAQELMAVVEFLPEGAKEPVRAYVSLSADRRSGGGSRHMADVLSDASLKAQLLADAMADLTVFSTRYDRIRAVARLRGVFREIEKATKPTAN